MQKASRWLLMAFAAFTLSGCQEKMPTADDIDLDEMFDSESSDDEVLNTDAMKVVGVKFSPDFKTFSLYTSVVRDMGVYAFTDTSQTYFKTPEIIGGIENTSRSKPKLIKVINSEGEELIRRHFKVSVLVDLSLPQYIVDQERDAVREIRTVFDRQNLFLSFMSGDEVTETLEATDYVLDNYFKTQAANFKYLYRSILTKKREMEDKVGVWADAGTKALIVFSDERVYSDDDEPIDPQHFDLEEQLLQADSIPNDNMSIYCVRFTNPDYVDVDQASSVLQMLCLKNHGVYQDHFFWQEVKNSIVKTDGKPFVANEFVFENPDGKIYRGNPHHMRIEAYAKENDSLIGQANSAIILGSAYNPVIVNGYSVLWMFVQGIAMGAVILLLVWLVYQFLIPYIRNKMFEKKYVVKYIRGIKMSVGNVLVGESCYYCKAQFVDGDDIVVKCNHVMHKSCWDENGYHCPEFGRHCKEGSHYYNHENLMDPKNASYYMKWILIAICSAILAWFFYMVYTTNYHMTNADLVAEMRTARLEVLGTSSVFGTQGDNLQHMPVFGLLMGFFLTGGMSMLCVRRQEIKRHLATTAIRATIVGIASWLFFFFFSSLAITFNLEAWSVLIDWIPWSLMAIMITFISTVGTRVRLRKSMVVITVVVGVLSMYLWSFLFQGVIQLDIRSLLLITCILFSVGLAVALAEMSPVSEHYFLNIKGPVKEMDIAVFKWFNNNPGEVLLIGKSIDCAIQMTWDLKGKVAPVHAEIRMSEDVLRLKALEEGVTVNGKPLAIDKSVTLYHNTSFVIGDTTFTYMERDL